MAVHDTIRQLQNDKRILGHCPSCQEAFPLRRASLFAVADPIPAAAQRLVDQRKAELRGRREDLRTRRARASKRAEQISLDVNVGHFLEKIAPALDGFGFNPRDCRGLSEPIDYLVFDGLSKRGSVDSITFMDIKSGGARLNNRQRLIKEAIDAQKVHWKILEKRGGQ